MNFESFNFGPEGFTRSTRRGRPAAAASGSGFGGFEDILKEAFGAAGRGGRPGAGRPSSRKISASAPMCMRP